MMAHQVSSSEAVISMNEDEYDELWEIPFVQIPNVSYVIKFKFEVLRPYYMILITNLREIYSEKLTEAEVEERFKILNPQVEMKPGLIFGHVKHAFESFLDQKTSYDSKLIQESNPPQAITYASSCYCYESLSNPKRNHYSKLIQEPDPPQPITLHLEFKVSKVIVSFDMKPQLLPTEKLRTHVIAPIVLSSTIIDRELVQLRKNMFEHKSEKKCYDSRLNKKSQITEGNLVNAFLTFQNTVQNCIKSSKNCQDEHNSNVQTVSDSKKFRIQQSRPAQNIQTQDLFSCDTDIMSDADALAMFNTFDGDSAYFLKDYEDVCENIKKDYMGIKTKPNTGRASSSKGIGVEKPSSSKGTEGEKPSSKGIKAKNPSKGIKGEKPPKGIEGEKLSKSMEGEKPSPKGIEAEKPSSPKDTQGGKPSSYEPQPPEMSATLKREIGGSSKSDIEPSKAGVDSSRDTSVKRGMDGSPKAEADTSELETDSSSKAENGAELESQPKKKKCIKF